VQLTFRWQRLRTKIILWSFVPTAIILLAVAIVTLYSYVRVTEDLVVGRNQELARLSAGKLIAELGQYADLLAALARMPEVYGGQPAAQREALKRSANRWMVFDGGVVILDSAGRVVAAEPARDEVLGQDWSDRAYFRQMLRSPGTVFSDITADGPHSTQVIVVAVPIVGEQGQVSGVMAGMFRLGATGVSAYYGSIAKLRIGEAGNTYLVDGSGRVMYHTDTTLIGHNFSSLSAVRQVLGGKVGNLHTTDFDGLDILASFAPVPGTHWGLITEESWATLMSSGQSYQQFLYLLLALGVIVPAAVVAIGVNRLTRPIQDMIAASSQVADGNFDQTVTAATGDELEDLARNFNRMSAHLREYYAELERRVADRTKELATLNSIATVVSGSLDLDEVMADALEQVMEVTDTEGGVAYRMENGDERLSIVAHRGLPEEVLRGFEQREVSIGLTGEAARTKRPAVMPVEQYPPGNLKDLLAAAGFQLGISVPLISKGKTLGFINLGTRRLREVTPDELSLLAAIGQQVGLAVENARLYQRAEQAAAAAERSRLARDLHDAVTQTLFSASLIAEVLPRLWERNPEDGRRRLLELRQLTRGALAEMRTLLLELRPAALMDAPLGDLLRQLSEAITGRARVPVEFQLEGEPNVLPEVKLAFYRVAQEALNNVAKHAAASEAMVTLRCQPDRLELRVSDDGRGFDPAHIPGDHLGVSIMRERAQAIGASLSIDSAPGEGTEVVMVWVHSRPDEKEPNP